MKTKIRTTAPRHPGLTDRLGPTAVARLCGISPAMVTKLRHAGVFVFDEDGKADRSAIVDAFGQYEAGKVPRIDRGNNSEMSQVVQERARREKIKADREEFAHLREIGQYVEAAAARDAWFAIGRNLRDQLLALPDTIAPVVVGLVRSQKQDVGAAAIVREYLDTQLRAVLQSFTEAPPKIEVPDDK